MNSFLPVTSTLLLFAESQDSQASIVINDVSSNNEKLIGQLAFNAQNKQFSEVLFQDIVLFARFTRLATEDDVLNGLNVTPGQSQITVSSRSLPCDTTVSTSVNWTFSAAP